MKSVYKTKKVCSRSIEIELDDNNIITSVRFNGGCNGNTQGIAALVKGMSAEEAIKRLRGIACNGRGTSCADQFARAIEAALEEEKETKAG